MFPATGVCMYECVCVWGGGGCMCLSVVIHICVHVIDRFHIALFSILKQTHCTLVTLNECQ